MILWTFMKNVIGISIYYFPMKKNKKKQKTKKTGNFIYMIKIWLFKLYLWRDSTVKNIQYSIPFTH